MLQQGWLVFRSNFRTALELSCVSIALMCVGSTDAYADEDLRKTLVFGSDPYCPYTCDSGSAKPGFMVEFAREALEPLGYKIEYRVLPWRRVLRSVEHGEIDGAITVDREDARNLTISREPIAKTCQAIVTRKDDDFSWQGPKSLDGRTVAVVNGYTYGGPVSDWLNDVSNASRIVEMSGENAFGLILNMIVRNRVDATISDCNVMATTARDSGHMDDLSLHLTGVGVQMFIGIGKTRPDAQLISDRFDEALEAMKLNGRLEQLAHKYGISNWQ